MLKYIWKRLLLMVPVIIGLSFVLFSIMELTPGDPARSMLGEYAPDEEVTKLREELGLNDPFFVRYGRYVWNALHGDFGTSYRTNIPAAEEIATRFPATLKVAFFAVLLAVVVGIPVGIVSAVKQYSTVDISSMISALVFTSIPPFWLGLLLILFFSVKLQVLPAVGSDSWKHFIMPAVAMAAAQMATLVRMTRSTMLEVIRQDYIRTAKAKGATPARIIFIHSLQNALLPVVTAVGISFSNLLGGALIIENVFGISGLGTLMVESVTGKDTPMLISSVLFAAVVGGFVNLGVDLLYTFIDPRVKSQYLKK